VFPAGGARKWRGGSAPITAVGFSGPAHGGAERGSRRGGGHDVGGASSSVAAKASSRRVRSGRARRCAARKKRGKALGHPGKERKEGGRGREGSSQATEQRGHGERQRPGARARCAHDGEGSGGARAGRKAEERERASERWLSGGTDPTVGPIGRERRRTGPLWVASPEVGPNYQGRRGRGAAAT
jgi:hypothetical protein